MEQNKVLQTQQTSTNEIQLVHMQAISALDPACRGVVNAKQSPLLSESNNETLKTVLLRIYNMLGLPPNLWPGYNVATNQNDIQIEKTALYYDLKTHLPGIRLMEIEQAYVAAINGSLKVPKGASLTNTFGAKFSFKMIGECIAAYKIYSQAVFKEYTVKRRALEAKPPIPVPMTKEQIKQNQKDFFEELLKFVETNKTLPAIWAYDKAFIHAWGEGIIRDKPEEVELFKEVVKSELKEEAEADRLINGKDAYVKLLQRMAEPRTLQYECRKRRLIVYLRTKYDFL